MPTFGPLVAYLPTPRDTDGTVRLDALGALVDHAVAAGVDGVAVLGSTGGFAYLEGRARDDVVRAAVDAAGGRVPVMAGVSALTTNDVLTRAAGATAAGASAVLLAPMTYLPLTTAEVRGLYRTVGERSDLPVWIYHNPVTTGVDLTVEDLLELLVLPGVGGCKDRGVDPAGVAARAAALAAGTTGTEIGFSGDLLGASALLAGARTWHSGLASVLPGPYVDAARAAAAGDEVALRHAMGRVEEIASIAVRSGGPRVVHAVGELLGLPVGRLPAPLEPPEPEVLDELERLLPPA